MNTKQQQEPSNFIPLRIQPNTTPTSNLTINTHETDQLRHKYGIEVNGDNIPSPIETFEEFDLPNNIITYLRNKKHFHRPTPIQMQSFSCLKEHRDCICLSSTGSGKTYGYILPLVYHLYQSKILGNVSGNVLWQSGFDHDFQPVQAENHGQNHFAISHNQRGFAPYCLIVVPTRELMNQVLTVTKELINLMKPNRTMYTQGFPSNQLFQNQQIPSSYQHHPYPPPHQQNTWSIHQQTNLQYQMPHSLQPNNQYRPPVLHNGNHKQKNPPESLYVAGFCGGISVKEQLSQVSSHTKVIISTPGRLNDLCDRGHIPLDRIQYFVIDECDKLLDLGMEEQLRKLVAMVTVNKTKILCSMWSATLPDSLERLARSAVVSPVYISTGVKDTVPKNIVQNVVFLHTYLKPSRLLEVIRQTPYPPVIIFTGSKNKADEVALLLQEEQFHVSAIHSDKTQQERNEILESFRNDEFDVLVATDLISRGLDLPAVSHVLNFDIPDSIEDYIHRCGRTGRFGRSGLATTFLTLHCKIAVELKGLLEACNCVIPNELLDTKIFGKHVITTDMGDRIA